MKHLLLAATVMLAAFGPDDNSRTVAYDPQRVVTIVTNVDRMTDIQFSPGERIKQMMFGMPDGPAGGPDPADMQKSPLLMNAPIWGKRPGVTTLTVITIMPDDYTERAYKFVIRVKDKTTDLDPEATYWLTFTYTTQQRFQADPAAKDVAVAAQAKAVETSKQRKDRLAREAIEAQLRSDVRAGARNWHYLAIGDSTIAPCYDCTWDNSRQTAMRFTLNTAMPTIYVVDTPAWDCQGKPPGLNATAERTAPSDVTDDMVTVHETDPHFRLRLGAKVVDIYNCSYDPVGHDPMLRTAQQ